MCRYDLVDEPLTDPVVSWGAEGQRCVNLLNPRMQSPLKSIHGRYYGRANAFDFRPGLIVEYGVLQLCSLEACRVCQGSAAAAFQT